MALNPAYWLLFSFTILYFRATNGFSRIREVMADIRAMDLYGGDAFKRGLLKVATNDGIFVTIIQGELVPDLLKQGKTISDFSVFMDVAYDHVNKLDAEEAEAVKKAVLNSDKKSNAYDSHPALKDRLAYAARFGDETETSKELVADLFEDWHEINKKAADMYNVRTVAQLRHLLPKEDASDADASSNEKE
jgi:Zn-dependent protease with chaperone function